jgi:hypothetical protein
VTAPSLPVTIVPPLSVRLSANWMRRRRLVVVDRLDEPSRDSGIMPKSTAVDRRARALCVELARVTAGRPLQWRMARLIVTAAGLDDAAAYTAIAHAIRKGWIIYEGDPPHICLTDQGRAIAAGADD